VTSTLNRMPNENSSPPNKVILLLHGLVKRRTHRASWVYILWLFAYLPFMVFFIDFVHLSPYQFLPLLFPLAVILVQLAYPTLLGWAVVVIPSTFFACVGVISVVITAPARHLPHDLGRLFVSCIAPGVYVLICVALWYARPKSMGSIVVEELSNSGRV
jgi:hypothetical protein